jgi:hypothetical protein
MRVKPLVALTGNAAQYQSKIDGFARENVDVASGAVVFFGSSSIRLWSTLARDFAPFVVVNRGFGGAHARHLRLFWRRALPAQARAVVVYAGDNDLAAGVSVDDVFADLSGFVADVEGLCPVVLLTVKRSPQRAHLDDEVRALNTRLLGLAEAGACVVVDVDVLAGDLACFRFDGLHLSARGYALWTAVLRPALRAVVGDTTT